MIDFIFGSLTLLIKFAVGVVIGLMLLRGLISWLNLNPFGWFAYNVQRITEPMVEPLRRNMFAHQSRRDIAPILVVVFVLILAYFLLGLISQFYQVTTYMVLGLQTLLQGSLFQGIRYLFGAAALAVISILITSIILQAIFSWVGLFGNRLSRLVNRISEPVLGPFRRMIPPMGMFDISPLIAIMLLSLISSAVTSVIL